MLELLIAVSAAAFGAVLAIIAFVAWAVRREDACLSMAEDAPGPITRAVRRLLGLHVLGVTGPARPAYHTGRRTVRAADWPAHRSDREGRPAYWNNPSGDWPAHRSDRKGRPAYWNNPSGDWPAHRSDRKGRPAYWNNPSGDWAADSTRGYEDRPAYRIDPPDDWPPDQARPWRDATLPAGPRA